jgi:DJ-1 family protein
MSISALVILAPGFEEIEGITPIDIMRRAGFSVTVAGTIDGPISAARETRHLPDVELSEVADKSFDVVVLPGGNVGAENLKKDARVRRIVERQKKEGHWVAAICAAPTVLLEYGWLDAAHSVICHPSVQSKIPPSQLARGTRVVVSGRLITSLAAGSAMEFAYTIVEQLAGKEVVEKVNQGVCAPVGLL